MESSLQVIRSSKVKLYDYYSGLSYTLGLNPIPTPWKESVTASIRRSYVVII